MKILSLHRKILRNNEHYVFHRHVNDLIVKYNASALGLENDYPHYVQLLGQEATAINVMRKNLLSKELVKADKKRDHIFRGLKKYVQSHYYHFNPEMAKTAKLLASLFKQMGNVADKNYDEESGALNSLINQLKNRYTAEVNALNAKEWVDALDMANQEFETLMNQRYHTEATKSKLQMKSVRLEIDAYYLQMVERLHALMLLNGEDNYICFVKALNSRIMKLRQVLAIRKGVARSKNKLIE